MIMRTMNRLILFLTATLFTVATLNVVAQEMKAGVIDKTGNFVISPKYDEIRAFFKGFSAMKIDDKWGIIDTFGKEVVPPKYEQVWISYDNEILFSVLLDDKWGFIDKNGKEVISPKYNSISHTPDCILAYSEEMRAVEIDGKWGFIDKTGREVIPLKYDDILECVDILEYVYIRGFHDGLAGVKLGGKWGFIDKTGREVIPLKYDVISCFHDGLAGVKLGGKLGFIDKTGREVVSLKYDHIWGFHDGLAGVKLGGKHGLIDKTGRVIVPLKYDYIGVFHDGLAEVKLGGKRGVIDKYEKVIVPLKYDYVSIGDSGYTHVGNFRTPYDPVLEYFHGLVDKTGREVVPLKYDHVVNIIREGLFEVRIDGKTGVIDKTGKVVIPLKYDYIGSLREELAKVKLGGKWGFIDKTGREVIPIKYDEIYYTKEGLVRVRLGEKWGFIDKTGREVSPIKYDLVWWFREGLCAVEIDGKWGYIDKTGKEVIPLRFAKRSDGFAAPDGFSEGLAVVYVNSEDIVLFEEKNKLVQETWHECNQQLVEYPYNVEKLQLDPVSITNFFLDPRLDAITDSIVSDLKQKSSELQVECYNNLKTNQPKVFSRIYLEQHPEAKSVLENLKLECRCNNYSEAELVVRIADNAIPECTCRNDYWNQYGNLFSSRDEFDTTYNTSEQEFLNDVNLRQSLKADIQEIASMLSGLNKPKFKDGLTGKNENIIQILQKVQYHQGKYYYDEVVGMMFATDAAMEKEWGKKGSLFSSRNEFYEAYVSGDYKNVLKEKKSK